MQSPPSVPNFTPPPIRPQILAAALRFFNQHHADVPLTRDNLRASFDTYFPAMNVKDYKMFLGERADMTTAELRRLLLEKSGGSGEDIGEDAIMLMTGETKITAQNLKTLINNFMPHSTFSLNNDIAYLMSILDKDLDGIIGPSDFDAAFQGFDYDEAAILSESSPLRRS